MKEFVCTILLFTSITCAIAQRAIGGGTSVNITQGVTASQVSDSLTEVRTSFGDSITEIRNLIGGVTVPIKQNIGGLYSDAFNVGDLQTKYPLLTYNELKTIRQQ